MARSSKVVPPVPVPADDMRSVTAMVHTSSGAVFTVALGDKKTDEIQQIHNIIIEAFGTLKQTKDFVLGSTDGTMYHFNTDNVECVHVKVD